jgi:hypothetical protein
MMEAGTIGTARTAPDTARKTKILFAPVTGPKGVGEYRRSLFLAQGLRARHPGWEIRLIVAEDAPYVDDVPVPIFRTQRSPTLVPDEVEAILRDFRPDVVVFDCSGRQSSLRTAHALGARTVFVSNHAWKRWKGFRVSRLRYTDEHWILPPRFIAGDLTRWERLKLRWLGKPAPIFLGPVFPEPVRSRATPNQPFFLCCPGGGGNEVNGSQSGSVFADAARTINEATGIRGVLVTGETFTGELVSHPGLTVHRALDGAELSGLLSDAQFAVIGGGDLLSQTAGSGVAAVSAPVAPDQHRRIRTYARAGLCIRAEPEQLARTTLAAHADGRLDAVAERLKSSDFGNGLALALERIERLAAG